RFAASLALAPPSIPYLSNVTGTWISAAEATAPSYWARHLRQTVRFASGVAELVRAYPDAILLEVAPAPTLATLALQVPEVAGKHPVLPTMRHPRDPASDVAFLLETAGKLWVAGGKIDWEGFHQGRGARRRVPLPGYPFERQRYWIESGAK